MKYLFLALILCLSGVFPAQAATFSVPLKVSQGLAFPVQVTDDAPFTARFQWRGETLSVPAVKQGNRPVWKAEILLGLPLDAEKTLPLAILLHEQKHQFSIMPLKVAWPQSILNVAPKYVEPPKSVQNQISRDSRHARKALATRSPKKWTLPLTRPVPYGITSPFGGRRVFNDKPRNPHKGTDLRSPTGTAV